MGVACTTQGEIRNAHPISAWKYEGKLLLARQKHRWGRASGDMVMNIRAPLTRRTTISCSSVHLCLTLPSHPAKCNKNPRKAVTHTPSLFYCEYPPDRRLDVNYSPSESCGGKNIPNHAAYRTQVAHQQHSHYLDSAIWHRQDTIFTHSIVTSNKY